MGFFDRIIPGQRARYEGAMDDLADGLRSGDHARALLRGREALDLGERLFGAKDSRLGLALYALASALLASGDLDESERMLRRALDDLDSEKSIAADERVPRGQLLEMLVSVVLKQKRDLDTTETLLRRWVDARLGETPQDKAATAVALNQLGLFLARRDKRDEAADRFEEARKLRELAFGPKHRSVAEVIYNAATFRKNDAPLEGVAKSLESAVDMLRGDDAETRSLRGAALHNLGAVLEDLGKTEEACDRYTEALADREAASGPNDASVRPTLVRLAQLHHREGRILFALALYERALAIATSELGKDHPIVRAIETWKTELMEGAD